jgi:peptide/nickel transport system permease protein
MKSASTFISHWQNALAVVLVAAFGLVAIAAPMLAPLDAPGVDGRTRVITGLTQPRVPRPPGAGMPLGTLPGSLDVVYGLVWGTRSALRIGLTVAVCTALLGVALGAFSGSVGGIAEEALMRGTDAFLAFPVIAGVVMFHLIFGSSGASASTRAVAGVLNSLQLTPVVLALICFSWMPYARLIDTTVVQIKESTYVQAARALGASRTRITLRHLIPNAVSPAFVFIARDVGASVILVAAFTFIGLGQESEWGLMLVQGRDWIVGPGGNPLTYWWTYVPATAALLLFGVGWNMLGDGLHAQLILHVPRKQGRSWVDWLRVVLSSRWSPVLGALIAGVSLGAALGWAIQTSPPAGIGPAQLREAYREDYLRAAVGSYAANHNPGLALTRFQALGEFAELTLETVRTRPRNVSSESVREFLAVIDPFRSPLQAIDPSTTQSGDLMAAACIAGAVAMASLAAIVALARRELRPRKRHRLPNPRSRPIQTRERSRPT